MSLPIVRNSYIPRYVKKDLKWYERDGLLTYIDQLEYERFSNDRDHYLKNVKLSNFDIIHSQCRGDERKHCDKFYQTITNKNLEKMPSDHKKKALAACARSKRNDLYVQRDLMISYFKSL